MLCLLMPISISAPFSTVYAAENATAIILEGTQQSDNEVKVDINVKENTGIFSMVLSIEYDTSVMELSNLKFGSALSDLDPIPSGDYSVYPFKISYLGTEDKNDYSTGKLATLKFKVKENAPDGDYVIKLNYSKNKDVTMLQNNTIQTKNLITNALKVTLKESKLQNIITIDDDSDNNQIIWIVLGSVVGVGLIAAVIATIIIIKKRKRKWVKI